MAGGRLPAAGGSSAPGLPAAERRGDSYLKLFLEIVSGNVRDTIENRGRSLTCRVERVQGTVRAGKGT